jgi:hypothetical protein
MATRPLLNIGDLVKLNKRVNTNQHDKMFRVLRITGSLKECRKLRVHTWSSGDGFADVRVIDEQGQTYNFKRRQLWRVPNQPRDKKKTAPKEIPYNPHTPKEETSRDRVWDRHMGRLVVQADDPYPF